MSNEQKIPFHHIDFLLPTHRFNIKFSYVSKKGLPFVREFILRLVHLAPMKPSQIAGYFDFSKREIDVGLADLVDNGDINYSDEGLVSLTSQSRQYFTELGSSPQVAAIVEYKGVFTFELASFKCTGTKRTNEKWHSGLHLDVDNENKATSEKLVKKHFQRQFYQLLEDGYISDKVETDEGKPPTLYKMELVKKIWQEPLRLDESFSMTVNGIAMERDDIEILDDDSAVQELITTVIHDLAPQDNIEDVISAMVELGDQFTGTFLTDHSVNILKLLAEKAADNVKTAHGKPFIGPLYSKPNWKQLTHILTPILDQMTKTHLTGIDDFIWLAPSNSFWGKSIFLSQCFNDLISKSTTTGKKAKTLFKPKMYVPLHSDNDKRTENQWSQTFGENSKHVNGIVEGFLLGNVEVMLLPGQFVAVCYHLSRPQTSQVSIPLGFMSTNRATINHVASLLKAYVTGFSSYDNPRDLGKISSPKSHHSRGKKVDRKH